MQKFKDPPYILLLVVTRWKHLFQKSFLEPQSPHSNRWTKCTETKGKELEEEEGEVEEWKEEKREKQRQQQNCDVIIICTWSKLKCENNLKCLWGVTDPESQRHEEGQREFLGTDC